MTRPLASPEPDQLVPAGPYILSGPVPKPVGTIVPLRGDLAHIALAGRYFVPHYAVPQPRIVKAPGAPVRASAADGAECLAQLTTGQSFDVLDIQGSWAWGTCGPDGPVGYVALACLEAAG